MLPKSGWGWSLPSGRRPPALSRCELVCRDMECEGRWFRLWNLDTRRHYGNTVSIMVVTDDIDRGIASGSSKPGGKFGPGLVVDSLHGIARALEGARRYRLGLATTPFEPRRAAKAAEVDASSCGRLALREGER